MIVLHKTNVLGVVCEIYMYDMSNNASASKPMSLGYAFVKIAWLCVLRVCAIIALNMICVLVAK